MEKTKVRLLIKAGHGVDIMQFTEDLLGIDLFNNKYINITNEIL